MKTLSVSLCLLLSGLLATGCSNEDPGGLTASDAPPYSIQVLPYPTEWVGYQPLAEMRGKQLGIISHLFVRDGLQQEARRALVRVVDIAIQEPTCLILKAAQSMTDPSHFILYEEWSDYDEFFDVQLSREYRSDFAGWLGPLSMKPAGPEFFEIYHDASIARTIADDEFAAIFSTYIVSEDDAARIRNEFMDFMNGAAETSTNTALVAQQSINDPNHLILYEEWSDYGRFVDVELHSGERERFFENLQELNGSAKNISSAASITLELFEIFYDPGKP